VIKVDPAAESGNQTGPEDFKNKAFLKNVAEECRNGDVGAMQKVYLGYKSSLFNIAYRFADNYPSAEDLLQEIFLKIFRNIKNLRKPEALNSWVYRIATNTCISFVRKKEKVREILYDDTAESHEKIGDREIIRLDIEQAVRMLPPKQKSVFLLHDVQGLTHNEVALIMGWSAGTSKSQLFKARMKIRNSL
jgi:RNA polymerase sigma-70 factor (ECF subfamily)